MMTDTTSYIEMLRKFGADLGLPKPNVDQLIETQKKNIEALGQSAQVVAQGAQSVAHKQRELMEAGLREAMAFARENQPLGKADANLAQQTEFARKLFEIAVNGAQETVATARQSGADAVKIVQGRMKEGLEGIRASLGRNEPT
jgi:phasin family protein